MQYALWKPLSVNHIMMWFGQTGLNVNRFETGLMGRQIILKLGYLMIFMRVLVAVCQMV